MEQLFGRYEAAALLAVEKANGGELAPLEQVLVSFEGLFGSSAAPATLSESLSLLIDARLVEWVNHGLELTLDGRKIIRRSGSHWDPELPEKVEDRLQRIEEEDLAPEGELAYPTEDDIRGALASLGRGRLEGTAPVPGDVISPSAMAGHHTMSARLLSGLPDRMTLRASIPGVNEPELDTGGTAAKSDDEDEPDGPPMVEPLDDAARPGEDEA